MSAPSLQDFILRDEQNFCIAHGVSQAWREARTRISDDFLKKLEIALLEKLPGWKTDRSDTCFEEEWATFDLYKPKWELRGIALQFGGVTALPQCGAGRVGKLG